VQPADAKGEDEKYTVLTVQPRVAIGSLAFTEIPAGMIDGSGSFKGTAAAEIEEEAKLTVKENDLLNLSELAFGEEAEVQPSPFHQTGEESAKVAPDLIERQKALFQPTESLESAIYPSPGACDEFMPFFLCQKRLTHQHMDWLKGKATGLRDEGEKITLKVVPLSKMWREAGKDAKALVALSLYENMKREGRIPDMPDEVEREPVELGGQGA
jgi:8-oxo-dGTP pyrophosphatase MutT (NUDIX family)